MSDIDTIREALKQAEKIIGKQPGLTSSALAALDRLQAQQPNAEPVAKAIAMVDDFRWAHEHAMELATATHGPMPEGYDDDDEPDTPWHCFTSAHRAHRAHPPASTEPPSYVYSKDYEALYDLLMRGGEALGRQWNHPGTRIVIPTDIRPLHVPQWQHMMMLDKARFAKVCSEMNLEWIAPSTEPRLTVEQAWPYLQHKKGCNMLSFTNSMMSHAPISQRLCDCGLDELRSSLTKAAKP